MNLSHKEQYLNMSTESALRAASSKLKAQRAYKDLNHGDGAKHFADAKAHKQEALHFENLAKECGDASY